MCQSLYCTEGLTESTGIEQKVPSLLYTKDFILELIQQNHF